jgi:predicted porin
MDAIKVGAVVEKITVTPVSGSETTNNNFYLAGKYSLNATDAVKLAYAKKGNTTGATNNAKQVSVGYDHDMSKRTSVYALYTKVTDEAAQTATTGNDPSTVSIGMKHAF